MTGYSIVPSAEELNDIKLACNRLWQLDSNRLTPDVDYQINLQRGTKPYERGDRAPGNLFNFVEDHVFRRKTFKLFFDLLNNYEAEVGVEEEVTQQEKRENWDFLNAVLETSPMQYAFKWLSKNHKISNDESEFKRELYSIWFHQYRREIRNDSSGFEHVFVGESRDGAVIGCHNWIQLYELERTGQLDYRGYIKPRQRGCKVLEPHENEQLISIQFAINEDVKPISSSLIGVSPEFEFALYSMCFLNGDEETVVALGPYNCKIRCHSVGRGKRAKIGTAFPEQLPMTRDQAVKKIQAQARGRIARKKYPSKPRPNAWGQPRAW